LLLAFASAVILGFESENILLSQIRDFFLVVSYVSQGYAGGIQSRLHTGGADRMQNTFSSSISYYMRICCRGNVFTEPLPRNGSAAYDTF
jgi:hypothetical protein